MNTKCLGEHGRRVENEIILLLYNNVFEYKKHVHKIFQHLQIKTITEFFLSTVDLFISVLHIDFLCKWKNLRQEMLRDSGYKRRPNSFYVWSFGTTADYQVLQIIYVGNPFTFFQCLLVYYNMSKEKID